MVWGGRRLEKVLGKPLPGSEPYGEAWELSDHVSHSSRIADGPLAEAAVAWHDFLVGGDGHDVGEAFQIVSCK